MAGPLCVTTLPYISDGDGKIGADFGLGLD